jgi:hypothetical protein
MTDEEERRQEIIRTARANAESPRYEFAATTFAQACDRGQNQIEEDAQHEREIEEERVAQECKRVFDAWNASAAAAPVELPEAPPADEGRELTLALVGDLIAESMGQFVAEQIRATKVEMLSEINAVRLENIREQAESVRQQKALLGQVQELIAKLRQREFGSEELPGSRMN